MNVQRASFLLKLLSAASMAAVLLLGSAAARAQSEAASVSEISEAIENLDSGKFRQRQAAFRTLVEGGRGAIAEIEKAAAVVDVEASTRCVEALLEIAKDEEALTEVIEALERLGADPDSSVARLAKQHAKRLKMTDEERAFEALTAEGVRIYKSPDGNVYSVTVTHDRQMRWLKHFKRLRSVRIEGKDVSDEGVALLVKMPNLADLSINRSSVTDEGLWMLRNLTGLKSIGLFSGEFTPDGIRSLADIKTLDRLSIFSKIDGKTVEALSEMDQLSSLYLSNLIVSERAIGLINQLKNLRRLSFSVSGINDQVLGWLGEVSVPTNLTVSGSPYVTDSGWRHLVEARLIGLSISGCSLTDESLKHLAEIRLLESLSIGEAEITDEGLMQLASLQALRVLSLSDVDVTEAGVERLQEQLPDGVRITLRQRGAVIKRPAIAALPRIRFLKDPVNGRANAFVRGALTDEDINLLKQKSDLGTVFLSDGRASDQDLGMLKALPMKGLVVSSKNVTDEGISQLANHPTLESLGLWSSSMTDKSLDEIARIPELDKVHLQRAEITDEGLIRLIDQLAEKGKIKSLNLFSCPKITNEGLAGIGKLESLEQLFLNGNEGLTSSLLQPIARLTRLERLEIDGFEINEVDLAHLAALSKLETLGMSRSEPGGGLTNEGLKYLPKLKSLKSLTMVNASIDDGGASELAKLAAVERLILSGTKISDASVESLVDAFPNLNRLGLSRTGVTDASMDKVGRLSKLEWLWLDGTEVGDEGLRQLDGLKKLQYIYVNHSMVTGEGHMRFRKEHPATKIQLQ